jgi:hypothetical protein
MADLIAREELAQRGTGVVPATADDGHARLRRFGGEALKTADTLAREGPHLERNLRRSGGERVVALRIHAHDARGLRGPIRARKRRTQRKRHFAEDGARQTPAQCALDAVERLDDFHLA